MKTGMVKKLCVLLAAVILVMGVTALTGVVRVHAAEGAQGIAYTAAAADAAAAGIEAAADSSTGLKAIGAALAIGLAAAAGAIGMGLAIAKSNEGVARQPEASGKIQTQLMLGLVFIETAIIYALIVAILIIFVM